MKQLRHSRLFKLYTKSINLVFSYDKQGRLYIKFRKQTMIIPKRLGRLDLSVFLERVSFDKLISLFFDSFIFEMAEKS